MSSNVKQKAVELHHQQPVRPTVSREETERDRARRQSEREQTEGERVE